MPRQERQTCESGIYHVMLRGINHQQIFFDTGDGRLFLCALRECLEISDFLVHAWCLMGNHIHLLLQQGDTPLSDIMKSIEIRFVARYNKKHERSGHLFQDRFLSEPITDDRYFLAVLRYILQNPVKAGLVQAPEAYRWSSYKACFGAPDGITSTGLLRQFIDDDNALREFLNEDNGDEFLEMVPKESQDDQSILELLLKTAKCSDVFAFNRLSREVRKGALCEALSGGASIRQLARLTGLSKSAIGRMIK